MDKPFLDHLIVEHARQTVEAFVELRGTQLGNHGGGCVASTLVDWLPRAATFDTVWDLSFGELYASLFSENEEESVRAAAAVTLRLNEFGNEGDWQLQLPSPTRFCFDGWLLPLCDSIQVSAGTKTVSIRTGCADVWQQNTFQHAAHGWKTTNVQALPSLTFEGNRLRVLTGEALSRASQDRLLSADAYGVSHKSVDTETELLVCTSKAALGLIAEFADIYLPWVNQVVRNLVPLPERPGMQNSASGNLSPGVIAVSNQPSRCVLAEMLVHEATHHYLYILKRLGPIDDGTDETLYFSPFRNMGRPILYIVFAYHAFGNLLLFFRMLRERGLPADEPGSNIDEQIAKLEPQLKTLEVALQTTKALTPLGRALWEPLYERIHA
jgi:HEXXH motif-containing protein